MTFNAAFASPPAGGDVRYRGVDPAHGIGVTTRTSTGPGNTFLDDDRPVNTDDTWLKTA